MARRKLASICSVARGEALGRREFKLGKMAVPALSKRVHAALRHCDGPKATIKYLDAWARGWHRANAAAPLSGLGLWPFSKKKPPAKSNAMYKRMIWMPGEAPRVMTKDTSMNPMTRAGRQVLGRSRRKRRRR